jgi:hypothetical protein
MELKLGVGPVTRRTILGGALAAWTLGCGGSPPPAAATPAPAPSAPVIATAEIAEPAEPSHVVGLVRWRSPNATLDTVYKWTGIKLNGADLAAQMLDSGLAGALAFDAPVDAVVALDPKNTTEIPLMAVSVGVASIDGARRAFQAMGPVTEVRSGEFRVSLRQGKKKSDKASCLLLSARGPAPGRVVCGRRDRDVDALRGYMARTLPERDFGAADVHLELHAPPVVDVYAPMINQGLNVGAALARRKLELGEPTFDRALGVAATGISDELRALLGDLDTFSMDLGLAPERATGSFALRMKGQQSWTSGTLAAQAPHAAAAPAMFWSLPATALAASYAYPPEHHRFDAIRHTLGELLDGYLAHEGVGPGDRAPLLALFDDKYANDSAWVSASGRFEKEPTKSAPKGAPADPLQAAFDGFGWYLGGIATPNQTADLLKNFAAATSRPKLQAMLRAKLGDLLSGEEAREGAAALPTGLTFKPTAIPKELPKGSLAFELTVLREATPAKGAAAKKSAAQKPAPPAKLQAFVVPESARTWIIFGADKAELVKTMLAATEGAPASGKLGSRADLAPMKDGKYTAASFTTMQSLMESILGGFSRLSLDPDVQKNAAETRANLETTPNRGKTPILLTSEVALENGVTWRGRFDVPKGVIEDAIVLAASSRLMLPKP